MMNGSSSRALRWKVVALLTLLAPSGCDLFHTEFEDVEPAEMYQAKKLASAPAPGDAIVVMTWNIKFGGGRIDFFFDCHGDRVLMSGGEVLANLEGLAEKVVAVDPDVLVLNEVDVESKRSAYVDMVQWLLDHTGLNHGAYASQWRAEFVPSDGIGRVDSGNAILAKWPLKDATRIALSLIAEQDGLTQYFYLKRNALYAQVEVPGAADLRVIGTHLSAYAQDGTKQRQIDEVKALADGFSEAGEWIVVAGDFNALPPGSAKLKDFDDDVCPPDGPYDAGDFTSEIGWLDEFYASYQPAVSLEDYANANLPHFTHTTDKEGFWNRKLDYLFTNGVFREGSRLTHQGAWAGGQATMPLSDHAPVSVKLEVQP